MKQKRSLRSGFSIVEVLFATSIAVFVFGALGSLLMGGIAAFRSAGEFHVSYNDARKTMQWVDRDVKTAYALPAALTLGGTPYLSDQDTLILQRNSGVGGDYDFVVYDLVADGTNFEGNQSYRLERYYYSNYNLDGTPRTGASQTTKIVARQVIQPTGGGFLFNVVGDRVSVDLSIARVYRRGKESALNFQNNAAPFTSNGSSSTSSIRLLNEVVMRNG